MYFRIGLLGTISSNQLAQTCRYWEEGELIKFLENLEIYNGVVSLGFTWSDFLAHSEPLHFHVPFEPCFPGPHDYTLTGTWNLVRRPLPQDMKLPRPAESISPHLLRLHNHPPQISTGYLIHCVPPTNPLINPFHPGLQPSTFCIHSKWTQTSVSQAFLHGVSLLSDFLIHFYLLILQFFQGWSGGRSQTPWLIHLLKNQKPYLFITNLTLMDEATICVKF